MVKVSVIIPTYNNLNDIERCVESIINQTYNDFEIIIVDDCSTDGTYELVNKIYGNYDNIKIFKNNINMKSAYTRNKAIKVAQGDLIAIQDADDYSDSERLMKQVEFLNYHKDIDFVGSNASSFDDDGIWKKSNLEKNPLFKDFEKGHPFVHASITFRKNVLSKVDGYRVSRETARGQDYDLLMRLYISGFRGSNLQDNLYFYYENFHTVKKRNLKSRFYATKMKLKYFPWKSMSVSGRVKLIRTIIIGFIPSRLWYKIMKFRSNRSLVESKENDNEK